MQDKNTIISTIKQVRQRGFILLPVVLTLTILASIAFMLSRQSAINTGGVVREMQSETARYVAQAGLNHALWQANKTGTCTGYSNLTDIPLGAHSYSTTIIPTSGSPVAISATAYHAQGATHNLSLTAAKIFQAQSTVTLQLGTDPGRDSLIDAWYDTKNFGDYQLMVSSDPSWLINGLIYFDLTSLPAGVTILSAQLQLYQKSKIGTISDAAIEVHRIKQDWTEGTKAGTGTADGANWLTADGAQNWDDGSGGSYGVISMANTVIDSNINVMRQWDITALAQGWINGTYANQGLLLKGSGAMNVTFASKEDTVAANRPKLTIIYACECGQSCDIAPPTTFCNADYTPSTIQSDYASSAFGAADTQAITYLPEGLVFDGVTSPAGGAWVLIDPVEVKFFMTDMGGTLLKSLQLPISSAHGGVFISSGTYANHIAVTNTSGGLVYVDMNGKNVSGTLASGSSQAAGIGFVDTSSSGTYDEHILILDRAAEVVIVRTQAGVDVKKIDVNDATSMPVQDVNHLPGSDKIIVTYDPNKAIIYDLNGTKLREYDLSSFGVTLAESIAINPLTCEHVVADRGTDRVIALNYTETLPIAHWKLDETSGTTAVDSVGGHDGTLLDDPVWSAGQVDGALNFDGTYDAIRVPHADTLTLTNKMTFIAWMNASSLISFYQPILAKESVDIADSNYYFATSGQDLIFGFILGGGFREVIATGANLQTGTWYQVAVTFDNATGKVVFYIDGKQVHTDTLGFSPPADVADLMIGGSPYGAYWRGLLDDVRIYNSVLTANEIAELYNTGGGGGTPPPSGPTVTLNPVADTYIRGGSTSNFGSSPELRLGRDNGGPYMLSLLRFDISAIPSGSLINSATLRWYQSGNRRTQTVAVGAYQITQDWTESGANWNTADGTTAWSPVSGGTYNTPAIDSVSVTTGNYGWYEWNITPLVQEWVDGVSQNYGVQMNFSTINAGTYAIFTSREGTVAAEQPQLVVDFTMP